MKKFFGRCVIWITIVLLHCVALDFVVFGQQPSGSVSMHSELEGNAIFLPIQKKGNGLYRLGEIQINRNTRTILFPAKVNMDKGLLEYVLVKSTGKTHESLLRTSVEPYYLNIAFLLLGFEPSDRPIAEQGAAERPQGAPVKVVLLVKKEGKTVSVVPDQWIVKKGSRGEDTSPRLEWVYTGSMVMQGKFLAQTSGSLVALYHDPAALMDNTDPDGDNDEIWYVNEKTVPPAGTDIIIKISSAER